MKLNIRGNIPTKLKIFARPESVLRRGWDNIHEDVIEYKVREIFVTDQEREKTHETASYWLNGVYSKDPNHSLKCKVLDNIPNKEITDLRILTLEIRGQGGRAYKVSATIGDIKNACFDLREDVLLECIHEGILKKDGYIDGKFIFAKIESQMKIIRVGSFLHKCVLNYQNTKSLGNIKDLSVGTVYEDLKGNKFLYQGKMWTYEYKTKYEYCDPYMEFSNKIILVYDLKPIRVHVLHEIYCYNNKFSYNLMARKNVNFKVISEFQNVGDIQQIFKDSINGYIKYKTNKLECFDILNLNENKGYLNPIFKYSNEEKTEIINA